MKIYLHTHGCRLNAAETQNLKEQLFFMGHEIVQNMDPSVEVAIVNTCAVTNLAEQKCRQTLRQILKKNPKIALIVTGCLAEKNPDSLSQLGKRVYIVKNADKHTIPERLEELFHEAFATKKEQIQNVGTFTFPCRLKETYNKRYNLKIQEGCDFFCAYCIIPRLRGRSRSRDFKNLIEDAKLHIEKGVKEIILTGVNMGLYRDGSKNLSDVVTELNQIPGLERIRLSSIELKTIPDGILEQMQDPTNKLVKYLHLPLQSGSDRILQRMRRHYTIAEAQSYLEMLAKNIPGIGLGTDLIVGFPGESESDFEDSVTLVRDSPLQYAHIFSYSVREGTVAAMMKEQFLTKAVIAERSQRLHAISYEKHQKFLESYIGKTEKVLFEDREQNTFPGLTENYIRVIMQDTQNDLTNQMHPVKLTELKKGYLLGML